jgi:hypothetical protein
MDEEQWKVFDSSSREDGSRMKGEGSKRKMIGGSIKRKEMMVGAGIKVEQVTPGSNPVSISGMHNRSIRVEGVLLNLEEVDPIWRWIGGRKGGGGLFTSRRCWYEGHK